MNRIAYHFNNSSIRTKLIVCFFMFSLIPTLLITLLSGMLYENTMLRQQNTNTSQMVNQISSDVDFYINDVENTITTLGDDPRIIRFLTEKAGAHNSKAIEDNAYQALLDMSSHSKGIAGMMVVSQNDHYVSDVLYRISSDPLTAENWYTQSVGNPDSIQLFSEPVGRNIRNIFEYSADEVVSVTKAIRIKYTNKIVGVILIDMKLDIFKNVIENVKPGGTGFIYIIDKKGENVYAPVNSVVDRIKSNWFNGPDLSIFEKYITGKKYEFIDRSSKYTGWKTVGVFPLDENLKIVTYIRNISYLLMIMVFFIAILMALLFSRYIANPITKLRKLMKETESGNFNVRFNSKYNDEIGQLGYSFNTMVYKIKELISVVQSQEKAKRKAEIEILQAQIKPHFLYNTLDTIQWMAQELNAHEIVELVNSLTNLLRIGLNKGKEVIELRQEIKHVESYLIIQKIRYEEKVQYHIDVDENMMGLRVIKLILQPLVENAIYHGIKEIHGKGEIQIKGRFEESKIHLQVIDNGVGIEPEKLALINAMLQTSVKESNIGYGIMNVNDRIKLNFGENFGLHFSSVYGQGTTVDIWLPVINGDSELERN
jgi:two-component system, sensor histidine kinase YesM